MGEPWPGATHAPWRSRYPRANSPCLTPRSVSAGDLLVGKVCPNTNAPGPRSPRAPSSSSARDEPRRALVISSVEGFAFAKHAVFGVWAISRAVCGCAGRAEFGRKPDPGRARISLMGYRASTTCFGDNPNPCLGFEGSGLLSLPALKRFPDESRLIPDES